MRSDVFVSPLHWRLGIEPSLLLLMLVRDRADSVHGFDLRTGEPMPVTIRTTDGQHLVVQGSLGEVQQKLIAGWGSLVELTVRKGKSALVNTEQITTVEDNPRPRVVNL
jgi:uncharacterized protein YlzI (FlbEa/FlbD family)